MMNRRETEKYTKGFILKCMNVIIESRLGEMVVRKCSPNRYDWFNIALNDNEEVSSSCLDCLDNLHWIDPTVAKEDQKLTSGFTIDARWKVACELSLKTHDGKSLSLEYWMIENKPVNNTQSFSSSPSGASSPLDASPISDPNGSPISNSRNSSSFANVHSRMGLMIKSLMSLTRATPAFKLSNVGQGDQSHVICYRICQCDVDFDTFLQSINPEIQDVQKQFSSETRLGSIRTGSNSIDVSFCHRLNLKNCRLIEPENVKSQEPPTQLKEDHFGGARKEEANTLEDRNSPLFVEKAREPRLAFGSISPIVLPFPLLPPLPKGFPGLSDDDSDQEEDSLEVKTGEGVQTNKPASTKIRTISPGATITAAIPTATPTPTNVSSNGDSDKKELPGLEKKAPSASKPIVIPSDRRNYHEPRQPRRDSSPIGSADSYVFIDNRPPFAPDHDDIEILFTGPTPSFVTNPSGGGELLNIQETLDAMESEMESIDAFLESINIKSGEEEEDEHENEGLDKSGSSEKSSKTATGNMIELLTCD